MDTMDYMPISNVDLGFSSNGDIECVNVTIIDDDEQEDSEVFGVDSVLQYLISASFPGQAVANFFITIIDNDGK